MKKIIEKKYNAKYIYETQLMGKTYWCDVLGAIFWQYNPPAGMDNWCAFYVNNGIISVTSGTSTASEIIDAIQIADDEYMYSHSRHNFCSKNGFAIDGGRCYTKIMGSDDGTVPARAQFKPTPDGLIKVEEAAEMHMDKKL